FSGLGEYRHPFLQATTVSPGAADLLPSTHRVQHRRDRVRHLRPARALLGELLTPCRGKLIELRSLIVLSKLPLRPDPLLPLKPMQRRIERSGIHLENISRLRADHLANAISMLLTPHQSLQNQQIEGAL